MKKKIGGDEEKLIKAKEKMLLSELKKKMDRLQKEKKKLSISVLYPGS